jgi:hypothetical protein
MWNTGWDMKAFVRMNSVNYTRDFKRGNAGDDIKELLSHIVQMAYF